MYLFPFRTWLLAIVLLIFFNREALPDWRQEVAQRHLEQRYTITDLGNGVLKMAHRRTGQIKYLNVQDQGNLLSSGIYNNLNRRFFI